MDKPTDGQINDNNGADASDLGGNEFQMRDGPPHGALAQITVFRPCRLSIEFEDLSPPSLRPEIADKEMLSLVQPVSADASTRSLAGGRTLPKLLFITNKDRLASNIGTNESGDVISRLRGTNAAVIDDLDESSATTAAQRVRESLNQNSTKGVVILGGYDVVPAQLLDCLPKDLRMNLPKDVADADSFRVWSDDVYGDVDGDGVPEIPVSRIPDGRSSELVSAALSCSPSRHNGSRFGVRNVDRPAAEDVFGALAGNGSMLQSGPLDLDKSPDFKVDADNIYIWLHGAFWDATTFWGQDEHTGVLLDAFNQNIPSPSCANVVLAAACWGGLTVDTPAGRFQPNTPVAPVVPESSIALMFLLKGSMAFIGCTGSHYSPTGAPLHAAFWQAIQAGAAPAEALLKAKLNFISGMPHGNKGPALLAIEYKTYTEFTCLGLGW